MDASNSQVNSGSEAGKQSQGRQLQHICTDITAEEAATSVDELRILACDFEGDPIKLRPSVEHCIRLMQTHASNAKVHKSAILALIMVCEKHKMAEFVGQKGVIPVIIGALSTFSKDQALVKNVVLLARSLLIVQSNRVIFCEHGGFAALSSVMTNFPDRESIQCSASALIATLCYANEYRRHLAFANGVLALLMDALMRYRGPGHWKLQSNVCMALRNLSVEPVIRKEIMSQNDFVHSIGNIIQPSSHYSAVEEALGVCLNIVSTSISEYSQTLENACGFLEQNVMKFLGSSLKSFRGKGKCHEMGFALLHAWERLRHERLDEDKRTKKMQLAIQYATIYASNRSLSSLNVVSSSCLLIRTMVIDSNNRKLFNELDMGVATLVRAVSFLTHSPVHVEHSLLALGNAVFDSPAGKLKACEWGALRFIANAMRINDTNAAVAEAGLMAIQGLCIESEKVGNLASSLKFHDICTATMGAFERSPTIQERALAALVSMGTGREAKRQLKVNNVKPAVERAASLYPYSRNILALRAKLDSFGLNENEGAEDPHAVFCERKSNREETAETGGTLRDAERYHTQAMQAKLESFSARILSKLPSLHKNRSKP